LHLCHSLCGSRHHKPVLSWLGRCNLLISPSRRIIDSDITQRILQETLLTI
jgi:hypothetical protein